jgi:hypothetical protein
MKLGMARLDLAQECWRPYGAFGQTAGEPRTSARYQATKPSHHEINKAFEGRNYKPRRRYCSTNINQFTQGFALLFIKQ